MKLLLLSNIAVLFFLSVQIVFAEPEKKHTDTSHAIYALANQCYSIQLADNEHQLLKQNARYKFSKTEQDFVARFTMRPSALGHYLLYDQDAQYLSVENGELSSLPVLESEMTMDMPESHYLITPAEWQIYASDKKDQFHLNNSQTKQWLTKDGLSANMNQAAHLTFKQASACIPFPESETGASGNVTKTQHDDGSVWGFVDAHEHSGANHGFGGKVFHGANFHKLGIEHALADCEKHHGEFGSKDLMNISYQSGSGDISTGRFVKNLYNHLIKDMPDHSTEGYPQLTDWSVHEAATHQSLYYKWIERAYLGGMRLMVEYMESTEVVCEVYKELLPGKSDVASCNEMEHVDHQILKMQELQDYVDAQAGGPGKGWLRLVYSPEEAREVIKEGKLAVILGIEIENPFNCFLDEREGFEPCTPTMVRARLNHYYDKGVRALFPSHKFVNAFSAGDGDAGILELGDYYNSGQWRDYVDCKDVPGEYWMNSHSEGKERSMFTKLADVPGIKLLNNLLSGEAAGTPSQVLPIYPEAATHCQRNGFTELGITLIEEMMALGMIIDLGHTPKAALNDVLPLLEAGDYPAVHTHGGDIEAIRLIKGYSSRGLGSTCRDEAGNSELLESLRDIGKELNPENGLPLKGLSYDFNGFAGYNKPRFGELSHCKLEQHDPLVYPFASFAGDVVFEKLQTGNKVFDFNTDGLANIGLLPDLIEEARRGGASKEDISALFKTAEAYLRIWEKAEAKAEQNFNE